VQQILLFDPTLFFSVVCAEILIYKRPKCGEIMSNVTYICPPPHPGLIQGGGGQTFAIVAAVIYPIVLLVSIFIFLYFRNTSVFLRKRSLNVIVYTSMGAMVTWSCTALYDALSPAAYPCALFGFLMLSCIQMVLIPPLIALSRYRNEMAAYSIFRNRYLRASMSETILPGAGKVESSSKPAHDELSDISWPQAFHGHIKTTFGSRDPLDRLRHAKFARSYLFPLFYGGINVSPNILYYFIKLGTDPRYYNGCYGCELDTSDTAFLLASAIIGCGMGAFLNSPKIKKRDALRIVRECFFSWLIAGITVSISLVLFLTDPDQVYARQIFNWRILICFSVYSVVYIQTIHQVLMARRVKYHLLLSTSINQNDMLQEVLSDKNLKSELAKHLNSELCGEILPFLDAVDDFKLNFDKEDSKGPKASKILTTFINRSAPLEVNISHRIRVHLLAKLNSKEYSIDMFDNAYDEVKGNLLNDGFARYLEQVKKHTKQIAHVSGAIVSSTGAEKSSSLANVNGSIGGNNSTYTYPI
jgi:hypothetical protein